MIQMTVKFVAGPSKTNYTEGKLPYERRTSHCPAYQPLRNTAFLQKLQHTSALQHNWV